MSKSGLTRFLPAVIVATLLSSTAVFAAPFAAAPGAEVAAAAGHHFTPVQLRGPVGHRPGFAGVDHVEGRIAFLKAELKITDAQAPQWEAVAKAMRDQSAALKALHEQRPQREKAAGEKTERRAMTAPEVLARREQAMDYRTKALAVRADGQKQFAAAFSALYDQMSNEQKQTADSLLARHGRRHR
jgi:hypothetical protein